MEFFSHETKIPFMDIKQKAFAFSVIIMLASCISIVCYGLKMGLEFTGGIQMEIGFSQNHELSEIRKVFSDRTENISIQSLGGSKNILLRVSKTGDKDLKTTIEGILLNSFPDAKVSQVEFIGPQIGKELLADGLNAIIFALLLTMLYIAFRFEYRFAVAAIVALLHDPIVTLGIFSYCQIEFDLISLAGILTVLGYSLNDTIVVYDRIRENFKRFPDKGIETIVNMAINETLSRTIITSLLTLLAVLSLLFFGGESLHGFSIALTIGIIIGTYSSIYIAGALAVVLGLKHSPAKKITPVILQS